MPKRRTAPFEDGDTVYTTLAKDGSDAAVRDLLNDNLDRVPQVIREALHLYVAIQSGEVPQQVLSYWRRWLRRELVAEIRREVADEIESRGLMVAGGAVAAPVAPPPVERDAFSATMGDEEY